MQKQVSTMTDAKKNCILYLSLSSKNLFFQELLVTNAFQICSDKITQSSLYLIPDKTLQGFSVNCHLVLVVVGVVGVVSGVMFLWMESKCNGVYQQMAHW